jgi:hypothetical protein
MAAPALLTLGATSPIEAGSSIPLLVSFSGALTQFKNASWTPQNLVNCAVNADGSVRKTTSTFAWDAGCTSVEEITIGDDAFWFVANVPPNETASPFGGRQFFVGLTTKSSLATYTDIEFALQVFEGGVKVWENGVLKRTARAARNNGVYYIGIENGQIIYRADGEIIYRSAQAFTYPLRVGVAFFNGNEFDRIGGNSNTTYSYAAFDQNNAAAGSFTSFAGITSWNAPAARGRYKLRVNNALHVIGYAEVHMLQRLPWGAASGLPCPTRWWQLPPEYPTKEVVFDDEGAEYNTPYSQPVRKWRIEYTTKLKPTEAAVLDNFWAAQQGWSQPFYFYDEREAVLYDNVRFEKNGYTRDHQKLWLQTRSIQLIRRPI